MSFFLINAVTALYLTVPSEETRDVIFKKRFLSIRFFVIDVDIYKVNEKRRKVKTKVCRRVEQVLPKNGLKIQQRVSGMG